VLGLMAKVLAPLADITQQEPPELEYLGWMHKCHYLGA
jgi:hypothetical protein